MSDYEKKEAVKEEAKDEAKESLTNRLFGGDKKKKKMVEPEAKNMDEVATEAKEMAAPATKKALDSNPIMKIKHRSIMSQKPAAARKYLRSK